MVFVKFLKRSAKQPLVLISALILIAIIVLAVAAPWIAPHDPNLVDLTKKLQSPSAEYPLGTDHLGRCELSRLLYGAQISLGTAALVMVVTMVVAVFIGTLTGYRGGVLDSLFMRLCDIVLAFPSVLMALVLIGFLGQGLFNLILAMVVVQWVFYARLIRGLVLEAKQRTFI
ncbi:MAG: ABC transporter permease subunit, partial [Tumebacillaceae bacterium]